MPKEYDKHKYFLQKVIFYASASFQSVLSILPQVQCVLTITYLHFLNKCGLSERQGSFLPRILLTMSSAVTAVSNTGFSQKT